MKRLKSYQARFDQLRSEARPRKRGKVGRYVYLGSLSLFILFLFDQFAGDLFYLNADGMITQDISVLSPDYSGTVIDIFVEEGDRVDAGDAIARVRSTPILRDLAEMSNDLAKVQSSVSEMKVRREKLKALLPEARERADKIKQYRDRMLSLSDKGLTQNRQLTLQVDFAYEAIEKVAELEAEQQIVEAEMDEIRQTVERARRALKEVEEIYQEGWIRADQAGVVGTLPVQIGQGIEKGDRIAEIFHGERYVLAYVRAGTLYSVETGDRVALQYGFETLDGEVANTLPIAPRLPQEFQRTFRTTERKRLFRVRITEGFRDLPIFTKVTITNRHAIRPALADVLRGSINALSGGMDWMRGGVADQGMSAGDAAVSGT